MTGCAMKSEAIGADRIKTEGRQSIHRWRMSKIPPIVNGAEDNVGYSEGEEIMVRQANPVNLAAAVHDHISCTKSAELRKLPETKDGRVNLPLTDHMYANYSEKPKGLGMITTVSASIPPEIKDHVRCLEEIVLSQLNLIGKQNETIFDYRKKIEALGKELSELSRRVGGCDDGICIVKKEEPDNGSIGNTLEVGNSLSDATPQPSVSYPTVEKRCLTKCCGRSTSKHLSRSLKRRNMVFPDKSASSKRPITFLTSRPSISPSHIKTDDDEKTVETSTMNSVKTQPVPFEPVTRNFKKPHKKRGRKPRIAAWKADFLHTDKPYFLPDYYAVTSPLANAETTIDVPSWKKRIIPSFYQIEGTENIDDSVFQKRHYKYETEEKRRKKRDLQQQQREINEKSRQKQYRGMTKDSRGKLRRKSISLYPSPSDIQYIEITDSLPVIAFGHLIPVFQPSEFFLPWSIGDPVEIVEPPARSKILRTSICGQKVT